MKICMSCFNIRFPGKSPSIFTWGRQCADCKKLTPSRSTLIKVDAVDG